MRPLESYELDEIAAGASADGSPWLAHHAWIDSGDLLRFEPLGGFEPCTNHLSL